MNGDTSDAAVQRSRRRATLNTLLFSRVHMCIEIVSLLEGNGGIECSGGVMRRRACGISSRHNAGTNQTKGYSVKSQRRIKQSNFDYSPLPWDIKRRSWCV